MGQRESVLYKADPKQIVEILDDIGSRLRTLGVSEKDIERTRFETEDIHSSAHAASVFYFRIYVICGGAGGSRRYTALPYRIAATGRHPDRRHQYHHRSVFYGGHGTDNDKHYQYGSLFVYS